MAVQAITRYLNEKLSPQLLGYGVSLEFLKHICQTVEMQMLSALSHWNDVVFRKALLLTTLEEGLFYEPSGRTDIKCFVVLTLRNSPFESLQSDSFTNSGLSSMLTNHQIRLVTSSAITYFNELDFTALCREIKASCEYTDIYGEVTRQCPVAWTALTNLASSSAKSVVFSGVTINTPSQLKGFDHSVEYKPNEFKAVFDGYSNEIDRNLSRQLKSVIEYRGVFTVDCFKALSRNFEKLQSVIEFLLTRGCAFVTSNYYLENGYAERRTTILRAFSCENGINEMKLHFSMTKGLGPKHKAALEAAYTLLRQS